MRIWYLGLLVLALNLTALAARSTARPRPPAEPYLHAPAVNEYARHDPAGTPFLPTGGFLRPAGRSIPVARWPHGLLLAPDGSFAFVASGGMGQRVTGLDAAESRVTPLPPPTGSQGRRDNGGALALAPDGKTLYWSSGDSGSVYVI